MTVEFGGIGVGGDKDAAKFREYKDLDSGAYLNNFTLMLEKPDSAFHLDAVGGGVARSDQWHGWISADTTRGECAALSAKRPMSSRRPTGRCGRVDSAALTLKDFAREAPPTRIRPRRTCSWRSRRRPATWS